MNTNMKNGLATLGIFGTSALVMISLIYGIGRGLKSNSPDTGAKANDTVAPKKMEQDLKIESDTSRAFFEASQKMKQQ